MICSKKVFLNLSCISLFKPTKTCYMTAILFRIFIAAAICSLASCGGKKEKSPDTDLSAKDSIVNTQSDSLAGSAADSSLADVKEVIEKDLAKWAGSFEGFNLDSFRMTERRDFPWGDVEPMEELKDFFKLYNGALVYSPDSSQFIDLYSANIWLEKRGKKIVAIGDPDQTVMLTDRKTLRSKSLLFFGPAAVIDEAVWVSPNKFILAGVISNEDSKWEAILLVGDISKRYFRWFQSRMIRSETSKYGASGMAKLKIDEWE
jgi:hypothetical protein